MRSGDGQVSNVEVGLVHRPSPVCIERPVLQKGGLIVACPHSGRFYPPELIAMSVLDQFALRRSEDAFVDKLFSDAPTHGATLLVNTFARAFVDVNRGPAELDSKLIHDVIFGDAPAESERVKAGLGVIPRTVGDNISIYQRRLSLSEAQARLGEVHSPWHQAVEETLSEVVLRNGTAILIDCHSMPGNASGDPPCEVVLGDRFGASCAPIITNEALRFLRASGLNVVRNNPYAGGYSTSRHGHPLNHRHALQIEINRGLYMVEGAMELRPTAEHIRQIMSGLMAHLIGVSEELGKGRHASEVASGGI